MRNYKGIVLSFVFCILAINSWAPVYAQSDIVISGVVDGPLTGGVPKVIELYVINNVSDLSIYGVGSANNGGGSDGEEFTLPADAAVAGDYIYIASEATGFTNFFGFAPDYTSSAANINGDDAIELFQNGTVVDVFGDINVDGTGEPWDHLDGWAKRVSGTGPDGTTFVLANWTFSGPNALDGETTNATAAVPFPIAAEPPAANIVINEIDADTPGIDDLEFVELFDGGLGNTDLTGLVLVFFNGSDDASYSAFDLDGFSTDANGYFLLGNAAVSPTPGLIFSGNGLQNGADAVALFEGDAADFPNDTPITTTNLLDAIVYDTNDADDAGLLVLLNPGQPQVDEDGQSDKDNHSNQRIPNGSGGERNTDTYTQLPPTPAAENIPAPAVSDLLISGVVDGPLSGGVPKVIELYVVNDISDLSIYGVGAANNGGGSDGEEYSLPADAAAAGDYIYIASEATGFESFFGFAPHYTSSAANINGDDAIELFQNGTVVDVFGEINVDGTGQSWEYLDGWAKRISGTGPDGTTFLLANWTFSGPNALDGETTNATAAVPFPIALPVNLVINEIDADTPGSDALEFVELFDGGTGNTDLTGLVLVFFNGSDDASYSAFDLDGFSTDANGYFLLGNAAVSPTPGIIFSGNGLQNGADAVALFEGDAADFPNDTPITTTNLLDAIVYDTNDADDAGLLVLLNPGQPQVNEGGQGDQANHSNQRIPNGSGGARNTDSYTQLLPTPGTENVEPPEINAEIFEIQGPGLISPLLGQLVLTEDNIVTAVASNGFFIQTPAARVDADINTSDGIFVFTGGAPTVAVGDQVDVSGEVVEFFELTEIGNTTLINIDNSGNALPAYVTLDQNLPSPVQPQPDNELERFEGMLVTFNGIATGPTDRFGDVSVVAGTQRAYREPGITYPGIAGLPVWDGNPQIFEINPDGLGLADLAIFTGQTVEASGPLSFSFGDYQVQPSSLSVGPTPVFSAVQTPDSEEIVIATLNMYRLFEGDSDFTDRLNKFSLYIRNVMASPEIIAAQEVENLSTLQALAAKIFSDDANVNYTAYLVEGNDVGGIDVGFLVRSTTLVNSVTQLNKDEIFSFDGSLLHDRPPLLLEAVVPTGDIVKVLNLHLRSLGSIDDASDGDRVRKKRAAQATSVSLIVDSLQTAVPDGKLLVTGDFNAFQFTDGYVDVLGQIAGDPADASQALIPGTDNVDPNLINEILTLPLVEQYSFNFEGSAQVLDHMLTSVEMSNKVTHVEYARGNSDTPDSYGANSASALRSSDHDGLVLYLDFVAPQIIVEDTPAILFSPNHKYHTFSISDFVLSVSDASVPDLSVDDVYITSVTSDEEENGKGDGNTVDDIFIVDCQTVKLRAERSGKGNGRVYTINLAVEDLVGNIGNVSYQVHVPKNKSGKDVIDDGPVYEVLSGCSAPGNFPKVVESSENIISSMPSDFMLKQNYPNPFNPSTTITYDIPQLLDGKIAVKVSIYNILGQKVVELFNGTIETGTHSVKWNGLDQQGNAVPAGIYIYQITSELFTQSKKMMYLK